MYTEITEELRLDDGSRRYSFDPALFNGVLIEGARHYSFPLCRKKTALGDITIDQWWMKRSSLYPDRGRTAVNYEVIVRYWWSLCHKHLTVLNEEVQENLILVRLLPHIRSNGARRVFSNAVPGRSKKAGTDRKEVISQLDSALSQSRHKSLDMQQFRDQTANCLGPPRYEEDIWDAYRQFSLELFGETRSALERFGDAGLIISQQKWDHWDRSIARRRGQEVKKEVLNILSFESISALHQCYSAVWRDLLPHLANKYEMSDAEYSFHRLWHFDQSFPSDHPEARFHLFHGLPLALHTACGDFVSTKTGAEMMGEWLEADDDQAFRRVLHGLLVAMHLYAQRNDLYALLRKGPCSFIDGQELDQRAST